MTQPTDTLPARRPGRPAWPALLVALFLAACQSSSPGDALDLGEGKEPQAPAEAGLAGGNEKIGNGPVAVAYLLPLAGDNAGAARAVRNGAVLAERELASGALTLHIVDRTGAAGSAQALATVPEAANARMVVALGGIDAATANGRVAIALDSPGAARAKGVLGFVSDDADSLMAGLAHALNAGASAVAILIPSDGSSSRIANALGNVAGVTVVSYAAGESDAAIVAKGGAALANAQIVAFAGKGAKVASLAAAVRRVAAGAAFVGHAGWEQSVLSSSALSGAIVAKPEADDFAEFAGRYRAAYGGEPSLHAAYGYDLVAIAAGIVRARGNDALTRAAMQGKGGFRGATGLFRFEANGGVTRRYNIFVIKGGRLSLLQRAGDGF